MNKKDLKDIMKLIEDSESVLVSSDNGCFIYGKQSEILENWGLLTRKIFENSEISKEDLKKVFKISLLNSNELREELNKAFKELLQNSNDMLGGKNE